MFEIYSATYAGFTYEATITKPSIYMFINSSSGVSIIAEYIITK